MIRRFLFHLLAKKQIKEAYAEMEERVRLDFFKKIYGYNVSNKLHKEAIDNVWTPLYEEFIEPYI